MASEVLRYAGFGEESVYGTAVAAVFHSDITQSSLDVPNNPQIPYEGGLSRGLRTVRPGWYAPAGNVVYGTDIRTIGWMLRWALGGYAFTSEGGAGTLNLHELHPSHGNELPSFTTRLGKDRFTDASNFEHVFAGCIVNSLQLQVSDGYLLATVDITASKDSKAGITDRGDLLLPDEFPLAFHEVGVSVDSTSKSAVANNLQLTISNNLQVDRARGLGSRFAQRKFPAGNLDVSAQLSMRWLDLDHYEEFWGGTDGPTDAGHSEFPVVITADAGADGSLEITMPRFIWEQVSAQPSGRTEIDHQVQGRALLDDVTLNDGTTVVEAELLAHLENNQGDMAA